MKKLIILLFLLCGCMASDPAQNIIYQHQLVGTWEPVTMHANNKTQKPPKAFKLMFAEDGGWDIVGEGRESVKKLFEDSKEIKKEKISVNFKFVVDKDKIKFLLLFSAGKESEVAEVETKFKLRGSVLTISNIKMKSGVFGEFDLNAILKKSSGVAFIFTKTS